MRIMSILLLAMAQGCAFWVPAAKWEACEAVCKKHDAVATYVSSTEAGCTCDSGEHEWQMKP